MKLVVISVALLACKGGSSKSDGDAEVIAKAEQKLATMLASVDGTVPECTTPPAPPKAMSVPYSVLRKLAKQPPLDGDPDTLFHDPSSLSRYVGELMNTRSDAPKSQRSDAAKAILAAPMALVVKIDRYEPFKASGTTFEPGTLTGRAIWLDATGAAKCAQTVTVKNGETMLAKSDEQSIVEARLHDDLRRKFGAALPRTAIH